MPEDGPVLSPKSSVTLIIIITLIHQVMGKVSEVKVRSVLITVNEHT